MILFIGNCGKAQREQKLNSFQTELTMQKSSRPGRPMGLQKLDSSDKDLGELSKANATISSRLKRPPLYSGLSWQRELRSRSLGFRGLVSPSAGDQLKELVKLLIQLTCHQSLQIYELIMKCMQVQACAVCGARSYWASLQANRGICKKICLFENCIQHIQLQTSKCLNIQLLNRILLVKEEKS